MARDNDYIKTMELWLQSMELQDEQTNYNIQFHKKEIEIHTANVELLEKQRAHDVARTEHARKELEQYLSENPE